MRNKLQEFWYLIICIAGPIIVAVALIGGLVGLGLKVDNTINKLNTIKTEQLMEDGKLDEADRLELIEYNDKLTSNVNFWWDEYKKIGEK